MAETRKKISINSLPKIFWPLVSYQIFSLFFDLISISFSTFIHFFLKHPVPVIEEWLLDHSWHIVLIGKVLSFAIILFGALALNHRTTIPNAWWKEFFGKPNIHLYVGMFSLVLILIVFGKKSDDFTPVFPWGGAILGTLGLFLFDYLLWHFLLKSFPTENDYRQLYVMPLVLFLLGTFSRFAYLQNLNQWTVIIAVVLFGLKSCSMGLHFIVFITFPAVLLFNGDFATSEQSGYFIFKQPVLISIVVWTLLIIYWYRRGIWTPKIDDTIFNLDNKK